MAAITERANNADIYVATRIHKNRILSGVRNQEIAKVLGISVQQMSKYERGENRISAGSLYLVAKALNTPIEWFFEGLATGECPAAAPPHTRQTLKLMRNFLSIEDEAQQSVVCNLARTLAQSSLDAKANKIEKTFAKHEENSCKLDEFSV